MILVVGSTGIVGSIVTKMLASSGKPVAAFVRDKDTDKVRALRAAGARLVVGDLKDSHSVDKAVQGVDTIVCTASTTISRREGDSIDSVDRLGILNLIDAAERASVKRFVYVSFSRNIGGDFPLVIAKRACERRLEHSRMDYVILLPSYFIDVWTTPAVGFNVADGKVRIYGDGNAKVSYIAIDDVAKAVAAAADAPAPSRKAIPIGGPKALSQNDLVALIETATGKKLEIEHMTLEQIAGAADGATDPFTATFLGLFAALARGDEIPAGWTDVLGVQPTRADDWVIKTFAGQPAATS